MDLRTSEKRVLKRLLFCLVWIDLTVRARACVCGGGGGGGGGGVGALFRNA